jgi:hypothetical protein
MSSVLGVRLSPEEDPRVYELGNVFNREVLHRDVRIPPRIIEGIVDTGFLALRDLEDL